MFDRRRGLLVLAFFAATFLPLSALAQDSGDGADPQGRAPTAQPAPAPPTVNLTVTVVGTTPLAGVELLPDQIAAPVQMVTSPDLQDSGALDIADFLSRRLTGVHVNDTQGNPFQPDVNYRGYTASPLLGTPQGLSVYMDGVRLNEPFGEVVSWDLIPRVAVFSSALMPGSNPLFGLNTLGGALAIQTKDGLNSAGTSVFATYGSDFRRALEVEHGGHRTGPGLDWYLAGNIFAEDGWRQDSPSDVRQLFGKLGWRRPAQDLRVTVAHADNSLRGNGLQETGFLDRDYASVYTRPDITDNRSTLLGLAARHGIGRRLTVSAGAYYRRIRTATLNGDINEESLEESLSQPGAPDVEFPFLGCLDAVASGDDADELCNGQTNRARSLQRSAGLSGQLTARHTGTVSHQFTLGAGYDRSEVDFEQSSEFGYLEPGRSVTATGLFDEESGVALAGRSHTWSVFGTDTLTVARAWHVTVSGRFNRTRIRNADRLLPGGGPGSLDGDHVFSRFNPAAGVTYDASPTTNLYLGYSEGSRAATSIELGCADPATPCKLPNAMAGDPPLDQVVTRTWESGARGRLGTLDWRAGVFHAENADDILFVTSERTGFGYFRNFGRTRRRGLEFGADAQVGRVALGAGYTFLGATFESPEEVNGESNSSNHAAAAGEPGVEGAIQIQVGDRMPMVPRHMLKLQGAVSVTGALSIEADLIGISSSYARGNENNAHEPDGTYYLGPGTADGYAVVNLGARYRLTGLVQLVARVDNVLDRRYANGAQLGVMGFTPRGTFDARPFPEVDGAFPVRHSTFFAPGAPRRAWAGTRLSF